MHPRVAAVLNGMPAGDLDRLTANLIEASERHGIDPNDHGALDAALQYAIDNDFSPAGIEAGLTAVASAPYQSLQAQQPDEEPYAPEQEFEEEPVTEEPAAPDWSEMSRRDQAAAMADRMRGDEAVVEYNVDDDGQPATDADWLTHQVARAQGYEPVDEDEA